MTVTFTSSPWEKIATNKFVTKFVEEPKGHSVEYIALTKEQQYQITRKGRNWTGQVRGRRRGGVRGDSGERWKEKVCSVLLAFSTYRPFPIS